MTGLICMRRPLMQDSGPGCGGANANLARHGLYETERISVERQQASIVARVDAHAWLVVVGGAEGHEQRQEVLRRRMVLRGVRRALRVAKQVVEAPRGNGTGRPLVEGLDPLGRRALVVAAARVRVQ